MSVAERLEKVRMTQKQHYIWLIGHFGIPWCPICGDCPEKWALDEIDHRYSDKSPLPGRVAPSNHQLVCWPCNSSKEDRNDTRDHRSPTIKRLLLELEELALSFLPDYSGTALKYSPEQIREAMQKSIGIQRTHILAGTIP